MVLNPGEEYAENNFNISKKYLKDLMKVFIFLIFSNLTFANVQ